MIIKYNFLALLSYIIPISYDLDVYPATLDKWKRCVIFSVISVGKALARALCPLGEEIMITYFEQKHKSLPYRILSAFIAFTFVFSLVLPPGYARGIPTTVMNLPVPGTAVPLTPGFVPPRIIGMTLHADNPLMFDFIIDPGDTDLGAGNARERSLQEESEKLVKYFLASLTVPAEKLWVNLSPYEKDKIVPQEFGQTEMGAELLAQDYMLKQLTASLMNPEDELGKKFWDRVYEKVREKFGTTEIPMNTFN